ncbi:MAG: hypothetical protein ACKKMR_02665 [Candidatus Nealsonbacteria bacterium]
MDFTINVEERKGYKKTKFRNLRMFHNECCGGEIKANKFRVNNNGLTWVFSRYIYLSLICKKCKAGVVIEDDRGSFRKGILSTAVDGQEEKEWKVQYRIKSNWLIYKTTDKLNEHIQFTITQIKPKGKPEEKLEEKLGKKTRKTISDLKEKLIKIEQAKREVEKEAKKTIEELKEKLAKVAQVKEKASEFYCPSCGVQLTSIVSFCPFCGINVEDRVKELKETPV